ncbi:hypothetical protein V8E36_006778, partial [Tilletia maclaganii]
MWDTASACAPRPTVTSSEASLPTVGAGTASRNVSAIDTTWASSASRRATNARSDTTAHCAVAKAAERPPAPISDASSAIKIAFRAPAFSPLRAGMFRRAVARLPAYHQRRSAHIADSITNGFSMGPLSLPTRSVIAPDHFRPDQAHIIAAWVAEAVRKGYAAGPFDLDEVQRSEGPVVTIPLTVVHTPAAETKLEKNRVCFNASWSPHDTAEPQAVAGSINFELRDEDIECEWFLITEVKVLLAQLPPWARVMGFDLEDAYQQLMNLAEQRRCLV